MLDDVNVDAYIQYVNVLADVAIGFNQFYEIVVQWRPCEDNLLAVSAPLIHHYSKRWMSLTFHLPLIRNFNLVWLETTG